MSKGRIADQRSNGAWRAIVVFRVAEHQAGEIAPADTFGADNIAHFKLQNDGDRYTGGTHG